MSQGNFYLAKMLFPLRVGRGVPSFRLTFVLGTNPSCLNLSKGFKNLSGYKTLRNFKIGYNDFRIFISLSI